MPAIDATTSQLCIRDYRPGDEQAIAALFNLVFGQPLTVSEWQWKYQGTGTGAVYARVAVDSCNDIICHVGAIPLQGIYRGKQVSFFQICDVMLHPKARGNLGQRNLYIAVFRSLISNIAQRFPGAFCYGFPGRRQFTLGKWARMYDKVECAVETIREPRRRTFSLLQAKPLNWTNPWLDRCWARMASQYPMGLVRDRGYLQWRYAENPFHSYNLVGLHLLGYPMGWAVIRRNEERLLIVDMLIGRRWLRPALQTLDGVAAATGARATHLWLPNGWRDPALGGEQQTTEIVTTNVIWDLSFDTAVVRKDLYYTMGDLDIF